MELHEYAAIVRRRWWLPVLLALLVGGISLIQMRPWQTQPVTYSGSVRILLGVQPVNATDGMSYDPRYYAWLTSEYLVDDFTEVVGSELFAQAVSTRLAAVGIQLPAQVISGHADTGRQHRILSLSMGWHDGEQLAVILQAVAEELLQNAPVYFQQLGTAGALVTLLDGPTVVAVGPSGMGWPLELTLRIGLGALAGLGLILFLHYMDLSLRTRQDLEEMGFDVLGEIPGPLG